MSSSWRWRAGSSGRSRVVFHTPARGLAPLTFPHLHWFQSVCAMTNTSTSCLPSNHLSSQSFWPLFGYNVHDQHLSFQQSSTITPSRSRFYYDLSEQHYHPLIICDHVVKRGYNNPRLLRSASRFWTIIISAAPKADLAFGWTRWFNSCFSCRE